LRRSGGRCDFLVAIFGTRLASPAARLRSFLLLIGLTCADGGWQDAQSDPLFVVIFALGFLLARCTIGLEIAARVAFEAVAATIAATIPAVPLAGLDLAFVLARFAFRGQIVFALEAFLIIVTAATLGLLLLVAGTAFLEHAEIVVGVLQIIFGLDAVARKLRVARQRLIFLQQLGSIAALAVILPVAGAPGHALRALSTAATTTAALTIVDQLVVSLSHWRRHRRSPKFFLP
jgi:hypothetical protein